MTRSEYMKKIDFLINRSVVILESYQTGWNTMDEFKQRLLEVVDLIPHGYCLAQDWMEDVEEGELVYLGDEDASKAMMVDMINCADRWHESKFSVHGSNSFLLNMFGEAEIFEVL